MRDLLAFGHRERQPRPRPLLRTMVGDVLRRTRLEQRRTLTDVATSARISMQYLSELERGRKEASSEILAALCAALRLDLSELLAAVGRELAGQRALPSRVVQLERFRDRDPRVSQPDRSQPDRSQRERSLPDRTLPDQPAAAPEGSRTAGQPAPTSGSGQPVCLLARAA